MRSIIRIMQRIHARVKAKARLNIYATIIRAREMNEQHGKTFETNASESADVRGTKSSFWFELCPPPVSSCRRQQRSPVNMTVTAWQHKLTAKKEGMTECCRDNDGARVRY